MFWSGSRTWARAAGPVWMVSEGWSRSRPPDPWKFRPVGISVEPLHPLVVRVEGGLQVSPGRVGHPHPLQSVFPTLHKVQ